MDMAVFWNILLVALLGSPESSAQPTEEMFDLLFAASENWTLLDESQSPSSIEVNSLQTLAVYRHEDTQDFLQLAKLKTKFDSLELSVFNYETMEFENCFSLENRSFSMPAMDPGLPQGSRHRMLPLCRNELGWRWSLIDFIEAPDNSIYVARYISSMAPQHHQFEEMRRLFTERLGMCRNSAVQDCYTSIREAKLKPINDGISLSSQHPQYFFSSKTPMTNGQLGVSEASSCEKVSDKGDLLYRIQKVAFGQTGAQSDRRCGFSLSAQEPLYYCKTTQDTGFHMEYRFYRSQKSCEEAQSSPPAGVPVVAKPLESSPNTGDVSVN